MVCETSVRLLRRPTFWGHRTRCLFGQKPRKPLLPQSEQGAAWRPEKSTWWKGRPAELPMPHRTSDGQGILRHCLHPLLEPASKTVELFHSSIGLYVKLQLYVSGTLLKGCHLFERILSLQVISSAMISIIILICKYIPLRTEQFDSLCVAQTILFKKEKRHEVLCPDPPAYPARNRFALMIATFFICLIMVCKPK